jgi:hypothetical protein
MEGPSQQDCHHETASGDAVVADVDEKDKNAQLKRKKRLPLNLTEAQQQDVADWYRKNEILYNRRLYKDIKAKALLFVKKAASMNPICTGEQLKVCVESMRTTVGKITNKKSGDEARLRTDREN